MPIIRANFGNMLAASKAIAALKKSGYKGAHLDLPESFNTEFSKEIGISKCTHAPSLSRLILKTDAHISGIGKAPLMASDPMVSGIGSSRDIMENSCASLVINVREEDSNKVQDIIKEHGGTV